MNLKFASEKQSTTESTENTEGCCIGEGFRFTGYRSVFSVTSVVKKQTSK